MCYDSLLLNALNTCDWSLLISMPHFLPVSTNLFIISCRSWVLAITAISSTNLILIILPLILNFCVDWTASSFQLYIFTDCFLFQYWRLSQLYALYVYEYCNNNSMTGIKFSIAIYGALQQYHFIHFTYFLFFWQLLISDFSGETS